MQPEETQVPVKADPTGAAAGSPMVVDTTFPTMASAQSTDQSPATTPQSTPSSLPAPLSKIMSELPKNRFELELEFVQSLASPAYLHYLATNPSSDDHNWLDDPEFVEFLRYLLKVWTRPEYNRFLVYPQALYFLEWLLNHRREEWSQVAFRNFAHQQQFMSWQHRASRLYGQGSNNNTGLAAGGGQQPAGASGMQDPDQPLRGPTVDSQTGLDIDPQPMLEG